MRPVFRGPTPKVAGQTIRFARYQDARPDLFSRLGSYCSYCEVAHASLAVEHVQPKSKHPRLRTSWKNFLLSCPSCNSIKGNRSVKIYQHLWPDRDNTFRAFNYDNNGRVFVSSILNIRERLLAQNTVALVGLDRDPSTTPIASLNDRRWKIRYETAQIAQRSLQMLSTANIPQMREQIVMTAVAQGCWSIWMTTFGADADMVSRFIKAFPGTAADCWISGKVRRRPKGRC